ncbi:hypothetical protein SDC9_116460 [bioreactor metagenome]|uniref:Uncharacterized protein n=1 Tax=bioreactor metagenome TaxID=1076179 RepID=A0A645BW87_9ZZZZ
MRPDGPQPLPGVLVQVPQAGIEGGSAPALDRVISRLVHPLQHRFKPAQGKPGRHQGLVCVPQHGFGNMNVQIARLLFRIEQAQPVQKTKPPPVWSPQAQSRRGQALLG